MSEVSVHARTRTRTFHPAKWLNHAILTSCRPENLPYAQMQRLATTPASAPLVPLFGRADAVSHHRTDPMRGCGAVSCSP